MRTDLPFGGVSSAGVSFDTRCDSLGGATRGLLISGRRIEFVLLRSATGCAVPLLDTRRDDTRAGVVTAEWRADTAGNTPVS